MAQDRDPSCLFCRLEAGEIPSDRVYEDEQVIVFRDVNPRAPTHVLAIPRRHVSSIHALTDSPADTALLAALFAALRKVVADAGLEDGYRVVTNVGPAAGQSVPHLHLHLLGGRAMSWPPG
jgi:histidine triad (HIT) family protein